MKRDENFKQDTEIDDFVQYIILLSSSVNLLWILLILYSVGQYISYSFQGLKSFF